jgi:TatD DNase family protein
MIDTHVHLDLLDPAAQDALNEAARVGVTDVVGIGVDPRVTASPAVPVPPGLRIHHALGLHPQALGDLHEDTALQGALALLEQRLHDERVVAVGETGLDARNGMPDPELQQRAFTAQLALAQARSLPVVLHGVRRDKAMLDTLDAALARGPLRGVWHGFSGATEIMREACARGLFVSVGFVVLNDKARRLREAVPHIPSEWLLVETDAPPLAPARLADVVARVAELRGVSVDEIVRVTTQNAQRLFQLPAPP